MKEYIVIIYKRNEEGQLIEISYSPDKYSHSDANTIVNEINKDHELHEAIVHKDISLI